MSASKNCSLSYRLGILAVFMVAYSVLYVIPNFFLSTPPQQLPVLWIDEAIPLIPWTFLIYTSDYFVFAIALFLLSNKQQFDSFTRMMFGVLFVCGMFFYTFPTTYPRPDYPTDTHTLIGAVMQFIALADSPRNCFPSMHVGLTAIATWSLRHFGMRTVLLFGFWSLAIFISTLTTKQHYFLDILGGLSVMSFVAWLETRFFTRPIVERQQL
ncbi:phosphatase PAP2 family protein [bacterium]|nr:phosphatase PAP2 family protein [bacterium]